MELISGGAPGADSLGERFATEMQFPVKLFPADWDTYGTAAGPIRNRQMAEHATHLIAFWDGISHGTRNMIDVANEFKREVHVVRYR